MGLSIHFTLLTILMHKKNVSLGCLQHSEFYTNLVIRSPQVPPFIQNSLGPLLTCKKILKTRNPPIPL